MKSLPRSTSKYLGAKHDNGDDHVNGGPGPYLRPHQAPQPQFETDRKKKKRHAQIRHFVQNFTATHVKSVQHETGDQKPHQRRQAYLANGVAKRNAIPIQTGSIILPFPSFSSSGLPGVQWLV